MRNIYKIEWWGVKKNKMKQITSLTGSKRRLIGSSSLLKMTLSHFTSFAIRRTRISLFQPRFVSDSFPTQLIFRSRRTSQGWFSLISNASFLPFLSCRRRPHLRPHPFARIRRTWTTTVSAGGCATAATRISRLLENASSFWKLDLRP